MGIALILSMVVEPVDIERIALFEAEDDAPVAKDVYRPESPQLTLQRMESEAERIGVGNDRRRAPPPNTE
jgi:hypothetical protein